MEDSDLNAAIRSGRGGNVEIVLQPSRRRLKAAIGSTLFGAMFKRKTEMPCGGKGECRGCRVQVMCGAAEPTALEAAQIKPGELAAGWRLACQARLARDAEVQIQPWMESSIRDNSRPALGPRIAKLAAALLTAAALSRLFRRRH